jgi:hypothetical protein
MKNTNAMEKTNKYVSSKNQQLHNKVLSDSKED